jgi:nucleoside-diphosphate-sugar epimerase
MGTSSNQRIVVLGAAGFIGFHLSRKLQELNNVNLVLVDNFIRSSNDNEFKLLLLKPNIPLKDT